MIRSQIKIIYTLLVVFLITTCLMNEVQASSYCIVKEDIVNIRKGPDTTYDIVKKVVKGDKLAILSQEGKWYKVLLDDKNQGYIADWLVDTYNDINDKKIGVVNESVVNVRSLPGTDNPSVGKLSLGQEVNILDKKDGWYSIEGQGLKGWIADWLLNIKETNNTIGNTNNTNSNNGSTNNTNTTDTITQTTDNSILDIITTTNTSQNNNQNNNTNNNPNNNPTNGTNTPPVEPMGTNLVLLHTHGTEAYYSYKNESYRTQKKEDNITGIGGIITKNLNNYGLNVNHITPYNDYPSYNQAYANSKAAVEKTLVADKKNIIMDVHRDGADEGSSYEELLKKVGTIEINNKTAATFTLVIGDANENFENLKKIAQIVKNEADKLYPGLCRTIIIRNEAKFNQYLSNYSMLIEIGSNLNTLDEASYTAELLSEILYNAINEIDGSK